MATEHPGEAAFWAKMIEQLTSSNVGKGQSPFNTMLAAKAIPCSFGQDTQVANDQLYSLGNMVPKWSLSWSGGYEGGFFGTYQDWVSQIHPQAEDKNKDDLKELSKIKQKIIDYNDGMQQIMKNYYETSWFPNNCLVPKGNKCTTWMPGKSNASFAEDFQTYKQTSTYATKVADLAQEAGDDLAGLQSRYNTLAQKIYGPNYKQLEEAQQVVQYADPHNLTNPLAEKDKEGERLQYQMHAQEGESENGAIDVWVPRYQLQGYTYDQFKQWLAEAKAGNGDKLTLELQASDHSTTTKKWQFSAGGAFPVEDIFMIGAGASGSHTQVDIKKYDFHMLVNYQSVVHIPIGPASSWFMGSLLSDYKNFDDWQKGSAFLDNGKARPLWGPDGAFNLRVTGVYVAYGTSIKFTVSNWEKFTSETKWHENASFSLFGLINIASESSGGETKTVKVTSSSDGFEMTDTSGVPKIIAVTVDTINYNGSE